MIPGAAEQSPRPSLPPCPATSSSRRGTSGCTLGWSLPPTPTGSPATSRAPAQQQAFPSRPPASPFRSVAVVRGAECTVGRQVGACMRGTKKTGERRELLPAAHLELAEGFQELHLALLRELFRSFVRLFRLVRVVLGTLRMHVHLVLACCCCCCRGRGGRCRRYRPGGGGGSRCRIALSKPLQ